MNNVEELKAAATAMRLSSTVRITNEMITFRRLFTPDCVLALIAQLEAAQKEIHGLKINLSDANCLILGWKQRVESAESRVNKLEIKLSEAEEKPLIPIELPGYLDCDAEALLSALAAIKRSSFTVEGE